MSENDWKVGDVVVCSDNREGDYYLTVGKGYKVTNVNGDFGVYVMNDEAWENWYGAEFFEPRIESWPVKEDKPVVAQDAVNSPIVSDGGSSSYYSFDITNKAGQTITVETGDVLRAMVGNDYDLSNIVKACRRVYEASQGRGKEGASIQYDCNKMKYFADEYSHWHKESV